jgi:hypothetical protein
LEPVFNAKMLKLLRLLRLHEIIQKKPSKNARLEVCVVENWSGVNGQPGKRRPYSIATRSGAVMSLITSTFIGENRYRLDEALIV